jgi:hypothetical protein
MEGGQPAEAIELPPMPLPPELPPDDDAFDPAAIERAIRAKIRTEVEAARERYAPAVPDSQSPYRRGINLALLVIDGQLDQPLWRPE